MPLVHIAAVGVVLERRNRVLAQIVIPVARIALLPEGVEGRSRLPASRGTCTHPCTSCTVQVIE